MNILLLVVVLLVVAAVMVWVLRAKIDPEESRIIYSLESMEQFAKDALQAAISNTTSSGSKSERARSAREEILLQASFSSAHGDIKAKTLMLQFIRDAIMKVYDTSSVSLNKVIPFDSEERLTAEFKFYILLQYYKRRFKKGGLDQLFRAHGMISSPRADVREVITAEMIDKAYNKEELSLSDDDKLDIIIQIIFQRRWGIGPVDEIREQDIDGFNLGVSGLPQEVATEMDLDRYVVEEDVQPSYSWDSVWLYFKGKSVHLSFLSMRSELELRRICNTIYTYGDPGQLSESRGFIINDLADLSRLVVVRPRMSESWALFNRKFGTGRRPLDTLLNFKGKERVSKILKLLAASDNNIFVTGGQGTGKSTLVRAMIEFMKPYHRIRIQEGTMFEMAARHEYPDRNILTLRETDGVNGQALTDLFKKVDGTASIMGEASDSKKVHYAVQATKVGFLSSWATHHAESFRSLLSSLSSSLIIEKAASDSITALREVAESLDFDIHLELMDGQRVMSRLSECVPVELKTPEFNLDDIDDSDMVGNMKRLVRLFQQRFIATTNPEPFRENVILEYVDGEVVWRNRISDQKLQKILKKLSPEEGSRLLALMGEVEAGDVA